MVMLNYTVMDGMAVKEAVPTIGNLDISQVRAIGYIVNFKHLVVVLVMILQAGTIDMLHTRIKNV